MRRTTKAQQREWQERATALPTRADIDRCIECWPKDWQDKYAFCNGQVATAVTEVERLRSIIEEAIIAFESEVSMADPTIARMYEALGRQREA